MVSKPSGAIIRLAVPEINSDEIEAATKVLSSGWLIQGEVVRKFEELVAGYVGAKYAIAVNSGTSALHLSLLSLGVTKEDEIITSDFTFPATANVIELVGAKPVLVDINLDTYNIEVTQIEARITKQTKAILPVHLFGQVANMKQIIEIAQRHNLKIIEDAAPALGSTYKLDGKVRKAGVSGDLGCFSFHPRKVITTGEGGMITTNDDELASKLRKLRNHGMENREGITDFVLPGYNYRMTEMQAAIGIAQMRKLDSIIARRQQLARLYNSLLKDIPWLKTPKVLNGVRHTYQAYVVLVDSRIDRCRLMHQLAEQGIETAIGTYSLHQSAYYRSKYGFSIDDFPNARIAYEQSLALPLYPKMHEGDIQYVAQKLKQVGDGLR